MKKNHLTKIAILILLVPLILPALTVKAAALTSVSDTLSRAKINTLSNHTIQFITPTGISAGQTITLTFAGGFTMGTFSVNNIDMAVSSGSTCTSFTDKTLSTSASGTTWGVGQAGQVITITSGTDTVAANRCVQIEIGSNATSGASGTSQITNPGSASTYTLSVGGTMADSGSTTIPVISDDQVQISATVGQTITFSLSANSVTFGTLTTANARYADTSSGSNSDTVAHTMTIGTNAATGYSITYNGTTLTKGSDDIDAATITSDVDGTPGTEQFALSASSAGSSTIATPYQHTVPNWSFVPSTTTTLATATAPVSSDTISARYLANIAASTPAGAYSTAVTYTASANF